MFEANRMICGRIGVSCVGAALMAAAAPGVAGAGDATQPLEVEEVVVTGTRIARDGFQAPTPLTVMSAEEIQASGVKDISEFISEIPAVAGSWDAAARSRQNGELTGLLSPALRNLGTNRTLVLLDGQRTVPTAQTGQVDTANFPQGLIGRVEVVTGGTSAVYGSDAVSGVVNYILDKRFTGLKSEISGGISDYGDNLNGTFRLSGGFPFAGGRGHVLLAGELYRSEGILGNVNGDKPERDWQYNPDVRLENPAYTPTNGQPFYKIYPDLGDVRAIKGATIFAGPLRGTSFGANGQTFVMNYGLVVGNRMSGGDWQLSEMSGASTLDPEQNRKGLFARAAFDLTDNINVYVQSSWNDSFSRSSFCCLVKYDFTLRAGNPFIPASVAARMTALNLASFNVGSFLENAKLQGFANRTVTRNVLGAEGSFDMFGTTWTWDAYAQAGRAKSDQHQANNVLISRLNLAVDAVLDPVTGTTVCRIKLTDPGNPCQPYNPLGWGVVSQAARDYVGINPDVGSRRDEIYRQDVVAASVTGEPFSLWAGPVSLAFGAEHRREQLRGQVDANSVAFDWLFANVFATNGSVSVTEGFFETVVPLLRDKSFADSLEFNGAVRATNYSSSGYVTTWKAGLTWAPLNGVRFRATRSRDIRAPNIVELYSQGAVIGGPLDDPFLGLFGIRGEQITIGNAELTPEKADTTGVGVVLQPAFLPALSASIDYYTITINDAIGSAGNAQAYIDRCFAGQTAFCDGIVRRADGTIGIVYTQPINFVKTVNRGIDFELSYRTPLASIAEALPGNLSLRWQATNYREAYSDNGLVQPINTAGASIPTWRQHFSLGYDNGPLRLNLAARMISDFNQDNSWIECDSGCPPSTVDNRTIQTGYNEVNGYLYLDSSVSYQLLDSTDITFSVRNLLDRDPPRIAGLGNAGTRGNRGTDDTVFDMVGRAYRLAVRIRM